MALREKYSEGYVPKVVEEDPTFGEKISVHIDALKNSFSALTSPEKIALVSAGVLIVGILVYVAMSLFTLVSLRNVGVKTYQGTKQSQTATQQSGTSNGGQQPLSSSNGGSISTGINGSVNTGATQNTNDTGISGILQNIVSNISGSSSKSTGTNSTTGTSNQTSTSTISQTSSSQSSQGGTATQPYIVNFLNGLLYFADPQTGVVSPYIVTNVNPASYVWETYINGTDGYSIEYPKNWTVLKLAQDGHEGVVIYPPTEDQGNKNAKRIGFGWSAYYLLPTTASTNIYYQTPITISQTLGQLYTLGGGEGDKKGIAVLLPHHGGYVAIGGSAETDELVYAFQHMLSTLTLKKN